MHNQVGLGTLLLHRTQYSTIWLRGQERITYRSTINRGYRPDRGMAPARGATTIRRLLVSHRRFIIVGIVFLNLSGGNYLSRLLYQFLEGKSISDANLLRSHPNVLPVVTIGSLVVIIALGYIIGSRSPKAKDGKARTMGLIPGFITGAVMGAELTYFLLPSSGKSVITTGT